MTTHESIRGMLGLAAAGTLNAEEMRRVEQHTQECEDCRRELDVLGLYAQGMRQLPQPVIPQDLLMRTQARILREREIAGDRRRDLVLLGGLAGLSFASSIATWAVVYTLTSGALIAFGVNWVSPVPWFMTSAVLSWMTAATAAIALGRGDLRRVYESIQ
jgi:predicted anti-sigma-YlaC factor YlaD